MTTPPEAVGLRTHPLTAVTTGMVVALPAAAGLIFSVLQNGEVPDLPWWLLVVLPVATLVGGFLIGTLIGYVSWRFTTYVIDGDEVRVQSGVLWKSSRRVPYERLQSVDIAEPLLARLVGLCELRLETAGGSDSRTPLRYLRLTDARALRRLLLDRAHGVTSADDDDPTAPAASDDQRRTLLTVPPARLLLGTLVSLDFALTGLALVVAVAAIFLTDAPTALISGALPLGLVVVRIAATRVAAQWDSTVSEGERGLRIERGLLSRTSQTIPWERVQGLAVEEPWAWKRLGWARLRVDVAGYGNDTDDESGEVTSTLVPVADRPVVLGMVEHILASRPDDIARTAPPHRSWPFAPIGWRHRWVGVDEASFVATQGWLQRRTNIVPHLKTQSVEVKQGPLQRRLDVATVEVHTPDGPVDADGHHLESETARDIALAQLVRARHARDARPGRRVSDVP
ncbi:PH domain-containing protein [Aeromicrobium sp. CF4.19]|uniref:PH domain-containing protein n=1 Tax=Aeromicrobium sp. CF4.19 TaxID=3373082 RepID=UPI003EE423E3